MTQARRDSDAVMVRRTMRDIEFPLEGKQILGHEWHQILPSPAVPHFRVDVQLQLQLASSSSCCGVKPRFDSSLSIPILVVFEENNLTCVFFSSSLNSGSGLSDPRRSTFGTCHLLRASSLHRAVLSTRQRKRGTWDPNLSCSRLSPRMHYCN